MINMWCHNKNTKCMHNKEEKKQHNRHDLKIAHGLRLIIY